MILPKLLPQSTRDGWIKGQGKKQTRKVRKEHFCN